MEKNGWKRNGWRVQKLVKTLPKLNNAVLIEGLPGIGNIGKITVDFIVDELRAEKLFRLQSLSMPNMVFIGDNNLIDVPKIDIYYKKFPHRAAVSAAVPAKKRKTRQPAALAAQAAKEKRCDMLFIVGDIQPVDERASYEFCYTVLDIMKQLDAKELVTIGGIGMPELPEKPRVFCTGNSQKLINRYTEKTGATKKLFGFVGPIVGVTGLLAGLAAEKNIESACFLAETYAHPLHLGVQGSKKIIRILDSKLALGLDMNRLEKEVKEIEEELVQRTKQIAELVNGKGGEASYIG